MHGVPVPRGQNDGQQEVYSDAAAILTPEDDGKARQEYKNDADVNRILARHGVGPVPQHQTFYSEIDFDLDLQGAITATQAAQEAYSRMPMTLRKKYPTYLDVLNGIKSGQFRIDLSVANDPPNKFANADKPEETPNT